MQCLLFSIFGKSNTFCWKSPIYITVFLDRFLCILYIIFCMHKFLTWKRWIWFIPEWTKNCKKGQRKFKNQRELIFFSFWLKRSWIRSGVGKYWLWCGVVRCGGWDQKKLEVGKRIAGGISGTEEACGSCGVVEWENWKAVEDEQWQASCATVASSRWRAQRGNSHVEPSCKKLKLKRSKQSKRASQT